LKNFDAEAGIFLRERPQVLNKRGEALNTPLALAANLAAAVYANLDRSTTPTVLTQTRNIAADTKHSICFFFFGIFLGTFFCIQIFSL
jgi:hypothetical protein